MTGHRLPGDQRCPTGKRRIRNHARADRLIGEIWATRRSGRRLETRAYQCPLCGSWHLTSKPALPKEQDERQQRHTG